MAFRIANLFVEEISKPIGRVLQPAYATLQDKPDRLRLALEKALSVFLVVITPVAAFLMGSAWVTIPVVLGDKWIRVTEVFAILVLGALFRGFAGVSRGYFVGTGRPKSVFWLEALRAASLVLAMYPFFVCCGMRGIAWASTVSSALKLALVVILLSSVIRTSRFLKEEMLPMALAIIAMVAVLMMESAVLQPTLLGLLALVFSSGLVFAAVLWFSIPETAHIRIVKDIAAKGADRVRRLQRRER